MSMEWKSWEPIADTVAEWIRNKAIKKRFRVAMETTQKAWCEYTVACKAEEKRLEDWQESAIGIAKMTEYRKKREAFEERRRTYNRGLRQWEEERNAARVGVESYKHLEGWKSERCVTDNKFNESKPKKPRPPKAPPNSIRKEPEDPVGKFCWPVAPGVYGLSDEYALLGAMHDWVADRRAAGRLSFYNSSIVEKVCEEGGYGHVLLSKADHTILSQCESAVLYVERDLIVAGLLRDAVTLETLDKKVTAMGVRLERVDKETRQRLMAIYHELKKQKQAKGG